jgi:hypothetical protein
MSDTRSTSATSIDAERWNAILRQLRCDGFSPAESIKITRAVLRVSLGDAKAIVHDSSAWADFRDGFEQVHDAAEAAVHEL